MDSQQFKEFGKATLEFLAEYNDNIRDKNVLPSVEPGYLSQLVPKEAPYKPEPWQDILKDIENVIMPGLTHWISPNFHAYYPAGNSYPSIVGEMIIAGLGCMGFTWICSPVCTELEVVTMNWLGKMLGLPEEFLNCSKGLGGGVIQGSASEVTLICLLAAKERTTHRIKQLHPEWDESVIKSKLVAYSSDQSNSSIEKAGILGSMRMRLLPTDEKCSFRGATLLEAIKKDKEAGLIPCYVVSTLGTTGTCAFDNLDELGPICNEHDIWLHVDAAYAGAAFVCPEYRYLMSGVQYADSFNFNPHKWLLVNFDCSALWVKNSKYLIDAFNVDRIYLNHDTMGPVPEYRNWQISLGRRFRSLKLWFVLRSYGVEGLQKYIRQTIKLARDFEKLVRADDRFEIGFDPIMALVCFRLKGDNTLTKKLLDRLNGRKRMYVVAGSVGDNIVIRFVVCSRLCEERDIHSAWNEISEQATVILQEELAAVENNEKQNEQLILGDRKIGGMTARIESLEVDAKVNAQKIS